MVSPATTDLDIIMMIIIILQLWFISQVVSFASVVHLP